MNTIEIYISPKRGKPSVLHLIGPSCWKELSHRQAIALTRLRTRVDAQPETLFVALRLLYRLKPRHQRWLFDVNFLRTQSVPADELPLLLEHGQNMLDTLHWIGQEDSDASFLQCFRRYDFHYGTPRIWIKQALNRTPYQGPADGLGNSTFAEFMAADKAYRAGNLPLLAAVLYRPAEASGERIAFDDKAAKARAVLFADLEPALLDRIAFSFGCTMLNLQRIFRHVFPKKPTAEEVHAEKTDKTNPGTWLDVAIGMAKFDVTKIHEIERINLYLALKVLNEQIKQADLMEAHLEKMKTRNAH